jgi:hypothetical protein
MVPTQKAMLVSFANTRFALCYYCQDDQGDCLALSPLSGMSLHGWYTHSGLLDVLPDFEPSDAGDTDDPIELHDAEKLGAAFETPMECDSLELPPFSREPPRKRGAAAARGGKGKRGGKAPALAASTFDLSESSQAEEDDDDKPVYVSKKPEPEEEPRSPAFDGDALVLDVSPVHETEEPKTPPAIVDVMPSKKRRPNLIESRGDGVTVDFDIATQPQQPPAKKFKLNLQEGPPQHAIIDLSPDSPVLVNKRPPEVPDRSLEPPAKIQKTQPQTSGQWLSKARRKL